MERRAITVRGVVQGVGFRPFVHRLASRLCLSGFVKNQGGSVLIEVEGETSALDRFLLGLSQRPPPLSRVEAVECSPRQVRGEWPFYIDCSGAADAGAADDVCITPDATTCGQCLAELFDPADRRYGYPFLNCTHCGPRLTIVRGAPYDRERTTMAGFTMCAACRAEYEDPLDRRFHAQPIACPHCGPRLELRGADGELLETSDPLAAFVSQLEQGRIGALKGLGGFHLVCDAGDAQAVSELRRRKHRDEQPFAVMLADLDTVRRLCDLSEREAALLAREQAPIVLLRKRDRIAAAEPLASEAAEPRQPVCEAVAPGCPYWGVLLPPTPLHHLLARAFGDRPLVMTSGNRNSEPIAYENDDALQRLAGIADIFLLHDRPIHVRCDDSVTRIIGGQESPVRRSRGYAPLPIKLPIECPVPLLAVGGQLKGAFALARGDRAFLSHHLGDLEHFQAYRAFEREIALYQQLFGILPELIVHDLHPDYLTTRYARQRSADAELPVLGVQHHHAHIASCMAEYGLDEPVIGVAFDGTGYGAGETTAQPSIWGGEFLVGDYCQMRRAAQLRNVAMPGGDIAIREPWRMGLSHLIDAGRSGGLFEPRVGKREVRNAAAMIARQLNSPVTSSAGRLFDAVAAIIGIRDQVSYEGQAAAELEWLATGVAEDVVYPFQLPTALLPKAQLACAESGTFPTNPKRQRGNESTPSLALRVSGAGNRPQHSVPSPEGPGRTAAEVIDTRPIIQAISDDVCRGVDTRRIARRFHSTVVNLIEAVCLRLRDQTGLDIVVLSGGVFANALLAAEADVRLTSSGFRVYRQRLVPPNDGGLCLGQVAVAAAVWQAKPNDVRPIAGVLNSETNEKCNSFGRSW